MPVIRDSAYKAPLLMRGAHIQTIFPSLFRKIDTAFYERERIETDDNDFLDLDWAKKGNKRLVIISHGLEGSSTRSYAAGMVRAALHNGWDALAWNFRSCSAEINRRPRFYHSGATDDLERVINYALNREDYDEIVLLGFSMGGNLTLVYLGEQGMNINPKIKAAVTFSVPCNLKDSSMQLAKPQNKIYMKRFLRMLHKKIIAKKELFPDLIDDSGYESIKTFKEYDNRYTAPLHGFKSAEDYWQKCSSAQFISRITIPTLIVNAQDDPFLADGCYPFSEAEANEYVYLEMPKHGGHVGFVAFNRDGFYWSEKRAFEFLTKRNS
jgi:predicted alpha/beta-fold hydrolase